VSLVANQSLVVPCLLATGVLGALPAAGPRRWALVHALVAGAGAITALIAFVQLALRLEPSTLALPLGLPGQGMALRLDALAAVFLLIVGTGTLAAGIAAIGHGPGNEPPARVLPFLPWFAAAMTLVPLADDAFTFLLAWEGMSLASWALVVARPRDPENARAGHLYLVMAALGTALLLFAFGLLAGAAGSYRFAAIQAAEVAPFTAGLVFVLVLLGTGSKAGLVPLHAWLPLAHPAAPSHVSALMSGVMTKLAVYAALRILLDLVGTPDWWWGAVLMLVGAGSAILGLLYALLEPELKRLLAYSTVENLGIAFVGLGLALAFAADGQRHASALALSALLLHAVNHALMKGLLFLGAGAVLHGTGTGALDRLGGLIRVMPRTAALMLLASAAISALPPLNGFAAEWLLFQAVLSGPELGPAFLKFLIPAIGAMLALAAALAAACFVRAYGVAFLGRPRSPEAANAHETDRWSQAAMAGLGVGCVLIGVLPGPMLDLLAPAVAQLATARLPVQSTQAWLTLVPLDDARSSYNGLVILAFLVISGTLTAWAVHRFGSHRLRRAPAWDCGFPVPTPITQYGAASFAQPLRRVFATVLFRARERVDMPGPGELRAARHEALVVDVPWELLYRPVGRLVLWSADRLNALQFLTVRRYLTLVFGALIVLLVLVAAWR
jgi:formate hydrogenlyase subunit 3/multisubunit Na+/H+ antiporter MnhD subunit